MDEKILFVDDDANLLAAIERQLRKRFDVSIAQGAEEGLSAIRELGPYAVVVSDLRMPGMDGIQFLAKVSVESPDTIRVMLTGNADLESAAAAVNEGHIFRFLAKPVENELLTKVLEASLEQYRLVTAERELLRNTLSGSIKVLTEVMSLVSPETFGRAVRLRRYIHHLTKQFGLPDAWRFELAAMLSQIGCVAIPSSILRKVHLGEDLTHDESETFITHAGIGKQLLAHIPRLELIAEMVAKQGESWKPEDFAIEPEKRDPVDIGAQMLKAALQFDKIFSRGISAFAASRIFTNNPEGNDPAIINALMSLDHESNGRQETAIDMQDLRLGMITARDVKSTENLTLVAAGQEVTYPVLERLLNMHQAGQVREPLMVFVPDQK